VLREATFALLREDESAVGHDVELALLPGNGARLVRGQVVQLGRETRSPSVIAVSDGAVVDLDLHPRASLPKCPVANAERKVA
jgi:hypothetical protein